MVKRVLLCAVCTVLAYPADVFAHEDRPHIMGTVTGIHANEIIVATQDGKSVTILLTKDTAYRSVTKTARAGFVAKHADLKPGSRVVVDVAGEGGPLTATQVSFSPVAKEPGDLETHDRHPGTQ